MREGCRVPHASRGPVGRGSGEDGLAGGTSLPSKEDTSPSLDAGWHGDGDPGLASASQPGARAWPTPAPLSPRGRPAPPLGQQRGQQRGRPPPRPGKGRPGWPGRSAAGDGRRVPPPCGLALDTRAAPWAVLLCETLVPLPPQASYDKWAFSRYDSHRRGSPAPAHISTLDLLRVHWPEIMSPVRVGGRDVRSGRFGGVFFFFFFLFNTLNMHYWISTRFL